MFSVVKPSYSGRPFAFSVRTGLLQNLPDQVSVSFPVVVGDSMVVATAQLNAEETLAFIHELKRALDYQKGVN